MEQAQADPQDITRTQAARLLGVSVTAVKGYPIPFKQYIPKSKALYKRADVLAFMQGSTHTGGKAA